MRELTPAHPAVDAASRGRRDAWFVGDRPVNTVYVKASESDSLLPTHQDGTVNEAHRR